MGNYPKLRNNTWKLNQWYDQSVAENQGTYINKTYQLWAWGENPSGVLGAEAWFFEMELVLDVISLLVSASFFVIYKPPILIHSVLKF